MGEEDSSSDDEDQAASAFARGTRSAQRKEDAIYGVWAETVAKSMPAGGNADPKKRAPLTDSIAVPFVRGEVFQVGKDEGIESQAPKQANKEQKAPSNSESFPSGLGREKKPGSKRSATEMQTGAEVFGNWEKHTQGIGMKLLNKMGFNGRLGANEQGVASAVDVQVRPEKAGLGAAKGDKTVQWGAQPSPPEKKTAQRENWKKKSTNLKSLQQMEQILKRQETKDASSDGDDSTDYVRIEKVVDLRFPQSHVGNELPEGRFSNDRPLSELLDHLRLIVDMVEEEEHHNQIRVDKDRRRSEKAKHSMKEYQASLAKQEQKLKRLLELDNLFDELPSCKSLKHVVRCAEKVFDTAVSGDEEKYYGLSGGVVDCAISVTNIFNPLDPSTLEELELFKRLKAVVDPQDYLRFIVKTLLNPFRRQLASHSWNVREPDVAVQALERWQAVMPPKVGAVLIDQIILPRLQREVSSWSPQEDDVPVHSWIFVWLPLVGKEKLRPLLNQVLQKFGAVIWHWHPKDPTAHRVLKPWSPVCREQDFQEFLGRYVVPKLAGAFDGLVVEMASPQVEELGWALSWADMLAEEELGRMLKRSFFPAWVDSLLTWAKTENPAMDDISSWYHRSKAWFPKDLLAVRSIKDGFSAGLDVISLIVSGEDVSSVSANDLLARRSRAPAGDSRPTHAVAAPVQAGQAGLKDLLSRTALRQGLIFAPAANGRTQAGYPVYLFGRISVYVDAAKQVVCAQRIRNGHFEPVSIEDLVVISKHPS